MQAADDVNDGGVLGYFCERLMSSRGSCGQHQRPESDRMEMGGP